MLKFTNCASYVLHCSYVHTHTINSVSVPFCCIIFSIFFFYYSQAPGIVSLLGIACTHTHTTTLLASLNTEISVGYLYQVAYDIVDISNSQANLISSIIRDIR